MQKTYAITLRTLPEAVRNGDGIYLPAPLDVDPVVVKVYENVVQLLVSTMEPSQDGILKHILVSSFTGDEATKMMNLLLGEENYEHTGDEETDKESL